MSSIFGLNEFNHLVHVSEVNRGLACQCRCVVCEEPMIARQGNIRGHHFAHASNREPCHSSHESLLHRYTKQLIVQACGLVAPITPAVAQFLGHSDAVAQQILHSLASVQEEVTLGSIRPDLLVSTRDGIQVAIEIAYSSFCDLVKIAAFEAHNLPALEIDLSRFTPENFDPGEVKEAVIRALTHKTWIWPTDTQLTVEVIPQPENPPAAPGKKFLPQETISFSGRWVSIRHFPSGDIGIKVVAYDPDLVSLVRSLAKAHGGRFNPQYKTWNVPRWGAGVVRQQLHDKAEKFEISMSTTQRT